MDSAAEEQVIDIGNREQERNRKLQESAGVRAGQTDPDALFRAAL